MESEVLSALYEYKYGLLNFILTFGIFLSAYSYSGIGISSILWYVIKCGLGVLFIFGLVSPTVVAIFNLDENTIVAALFGMIFMLIVAIEPPKKSKDLLIIDYVLGFICCLIGKWLQCVVLLAGMLRFKHLAKQVGQFLPSKHVEWMHNIVEELEHSSRPDTHSPSIDHEAIVRNKILFLTLINANYLLTLVSDTLQEVNSPKVSAMRESLVNSQKNIAAIIAQAFTPPEYIPDKKLPEGLVNKP